MRTSTSVAALLVTVCAIAGLAVTVHEASSSVHGRQPCSHDSPSKGSGKANDPTAAICDGLFAIRPDGSGRRILEVNPAASAITPDGRYALAVGDKGVAVTDLQTHQRRAISPTGPGGAGSTLALSPDGKRVAFEFMARQASCGLTTQVWVSNIDGSDLRKLSDCAGFPAWAPDSRRLALITGLRSDRRSGKITIDADGRRRQIASWSGSTPTIAWNGEWIAYISSRINTRTTPITVSPPLLHVIRSDGTRARSLGTGGSPSFSPDGKRLAFVAWRSSARKRSVSLRVAQPSGLQPRTLDAAPDVRPYAWSPDGRLLAYAKNGKQIYTVIVTSAKRAQVTHEPASAVVYGIFWPRKDSIYYLRELTP